MNNIHFVSGLPRAGSSLLMSILAQNPRFAVTPTSGILNILLMVRNQWENFEEFKANPNPDGKVRVLKSILQGYFANENKPVIFDKSRGWLGYLEMAEVILNRKGKVLCPVRDVRDCLASLEKLWRNNTGFRQISQEAAHNLNFKTLDGRLKVWADGSQLLGAAYNHIKDALDRGFSDRIHFVRFEELTDGPAKIMKGIYEFLEEPFFQHDFNNVEQVVVEDDLRGYGIPDLHKIRSKVEPMKPQWPEILGQYAKAYENADFWNK
jgi:sulfotransferase